MASSNINSSGDNPNAKKPVGNSLDGAAAMFVSFLGEYVKSLVQKMAPRSYTARVVGVSGDNKYDIVLISDSNTVIPNISNSTAYDIKVGDYVEILSTQNNLSVAFIINKYSPPPSNGTIQAESSPPVLSEDNGLILADGAYLETINSEIFSLLGGQLSLNSSSAESSDPS